MFCMLFSTYFCVFFWGGGGFLGMRVSKKVITLVKCGNGICSIVFIIPKCPERLTNMYCNIT